MTGRELANLREDLARSYADKEKLDEKVSSEMNSQPSAAVSKITRPSGKKNRSTGRQGSASQGPLVHGVVSHVSAESGFFIANVGSEKGVTIDSKIKVYRDGKAILEAGISDPQGIHPAYAVFDLVGGQISAESIPKVGDSVRLE